AHDEAGIAFPATHRTDQEVALPRRKFVAIVHRDIAWIERARSCTHGHPEIDRVLKSRHIVFAQTSSGPIVVRTVGDVHPSVILAGLNAIQFIAAAGTELGGPDLSGVRIDGESEGVAMPKRKDLRKVSHFSDKRVVGWNGSVVLDPQNFTDVG